MISERELQINPLVPESIQHNTKTLQQLNNLVASLIGIGAGILGLESYPGFLFYAVFTLLTSALVYLLRVQGGDAKQSGLGAYFVSGWTLWTGGLVDGLSGFILTWTLVYGLVRA